MFCNHFELAALITRCRDLCEQCLMPPVNFRQELWKETWSGLETTRSVLAHHSYLQSMIMQLALAVTIVLISLEIRQWYAFTPVIVFVYHLLSFCLFCGFFFSCHLLLRRLVCLLSPYLPVLLQSFNFMILVFLCPLQQAVDWCFSRPSFLLSFLKISLLTASKYLKCRNL